jgi:hypothetical protein
MIGIHQQERFDFDKPRGVDEGGPNSMSALGQKQTLSNISAMSALPPKADIVRQDRDVRFVPLAEVRPSRSEPRRVERVGDPIDDAHSRGALDAPD